MLVELPAGTTPEQINVVIPESGMLGDISGVDPYPIWLVDTRICGAE